MRVSVLYTGLLLLCSWSVEAQNFGNSSLLKYGLTANQNAVDVQFQGFDLTNSASKNFFLKHASTNAFALGSAFKPLVELGAAESSGESISMNSPKMSSGISLGLERTNKERHQGFLTLNTRILIKKSPKLRLNGYVISGNQTYKDDRGNSAWKRTDRNTNAYANLSTYNYNSKNRMSIEGLWIRNRGSVSERLEIQQTDNSQMDGDLLMVKLKWHRKFSLNHTLTSEAVSEKFTLNAMQMRALTGDMMLNVTKSRFQIWDEIKRRKNKYVNKMVLADNRQSITSRLTTIGNANYTIGMWQTQVTHFVKPNTLGVSYTHNLGYHSASGMVFNPGLKFIKNLHRLKFDIGLRQFSRTPSLVTEFGTFYNDKMASNVTARQEKTTKIFASSKFEFLSNTFLVFKYIQTSSNNKWLYNPLSNTLSQQKIKYSAFYLKMFRGYNRRSRFMLLYRNITPETNSANIFAQHLISGDVEYRIFNQSKRVFKRYRQYHFSVDLKSMYMSQHRLPFNHNGVQAIHKGGAFADSHLKLRIGRNQSYYRNSLKPIRLRSTIIRLGVNNVLNTGATIQPIEANNFKPILPRQVYSSITLEI